MVLLAMTRGEIFNALRDYFYIVVAKFDGWLCRRPHSVADRAARCDPIDGISWERSIRSSSVENAIVEKCPPFSKRHPHRSMCD